MLKIWVYFCCLFWSMGAFTAIGSVVLIVNNVTFSFDDVEANFAPSIKQSGKCGTLYMAEPLDACSPLVNKIVPKFNDSKSPFVLITRGVCSFEDKVRRAQVAGFKSAIVYDDEDGDLVAMAGNAGGIKIHAMFVSKTSGETLAKYAGADDVELWIFPNFENSAWSICVISFISLLAMSAALATCFFMRRHQTRREYPRAPRVREFHGMSSHLVKAMPSLTFTAVLEDNCTSTTCAICLEDYNVGEKLRILPCRHKFHAICVDAWLTTWRTFCPVCKRDAMTSNNSEKPASEFTPLLSSSSPASISVSSSVLSSVRSSSAIQISPSTFYNNHNSLQFQISTSQSSSVDDLRNISSQQSQLSRYMSLYIPSSGNGASSYVGSSSRQVNLLHYSESAASFSPFASGHSLPGC